MSYLWIWLIISLICLVVELATGAFVLVFFAISSLAVALLSVVWSMDLTLQILTFGIFGLLSLFLFRRKLVDSLLKKGSKSTDFGDTNQTFILEVSLEPEKEARVPYQGSLFTAINVGNKVIPASSRVRIVKTDGIKLHVIHD